MTVDTVQLAIRLENHIFSGIIIERELLYALLDGRDSTLIVSHHPEARIMCAVWNQLHPLIAAILLRATADTKNAMRAAFGISVRILLAKHDDSVDVMTAVASNEREWSQVMAQLRPN